MAGKVRKISIVVALIVFLLLGFCILFMFLRHPKLLAEDLNGLCFIDACNSFSGSGFGPSAGFILDTLALILSFLQFVATLFLGLTILRKSKYTRIS